MVYNETTRLLCSTLPMPAFNKSRRAFTATAPLCDGMVIYSASFIAVKLYYIPIQMSSTFLLKMQKNLIVNQIFASINSLAANTLSGDSNFAVKSPLSVSINMAGRVLIPKRFL